MVGGVVSGSELEGRDRPDSPDPGAQGCGPLADVAAEVAPPDDDTLARMAKALGHPARIAILRLLDARRECVTGDVVADLPLAQSTVSEHLRILREAGLVQGSADGPRTRYCVSPAGLAALKSGIASL